MKNPERVMSRIIVVLMIWTCLFMINEAFHSSNGSYWHIPVFFLHLGGFIFAICQYKSRWWLCKKEVNDDNFH